MFVVLVYDIKEERVNKIYKLVKKYLFWRQKSVFDGEINIETLKELKEKLNKEINKEEDSVIIYEFKTKPLNTEQIGIQKIFDDENIIINKI